MADEREQEMLDLMREATMTLRRCETQLNEIWAEWTRTHGLSIPGKYVGKATEPDPKDFKHPEGTVRRVLKK